MKWTRTIRTRFAFWSTALILALGFAERRKTFATLLVLGASNNQLGAFVWAEGLTVLVGGLIFGSLIGVGLARLLVLLLTHVFDPPPESLMIPWAYLTVLLLSLVIAIAVAVIGAVVTTRRAGVAIFRTL
jgi:putative ABC transport system permease protein